MKKIVFACIVVLLNSAFVDRINTDYRDQFIGTYICLKKCQGVQEDKTGITVLTETISLIVNKSKTDSLLNISIENSNFQVKLINNKMLPYPNGRWGGQFITPDSLGFSISIGHTTHICIYNGKK